MNLNILKSLPVPGTGEIREILVKRIDHQKQALGIVVGIVEPNGRRVVA
jgi:serine-type D-Ala-D-Ala carboxypeptidase/endopeptidase